MIAKESYKTLKAVVGPWFKQNGFKVRKSSYLTYQKPVGDQFLTVRFQCHHHGWEKHKGSRFTVFLQLTPEQDFEHTMSNRLTSYLTLPELELIRARQNRILRAIPPPPPEYINEVVVSFGKSFRDPQPYLDIFLQDWQLIAKPYSANDDIWFRYFNEEDVRSWAVLLHNHIRALYERLLTPAAEPSKGLR
jgi:hypothetical protein